MTFAKERFRRADSHRPGRYAVRRAGYRARHRPGVGDTGVRGFLLLDALGSLALVALLLAAFAAATTQLTQAARDADSRRMLTLAAEAELNRLRVGAESPATAPDESGSGTGITLETTRTRGTGAWAGFTLVRVVAHQSASHGRMIRVELAAYLPAREAAP
jgi:hypothetical protein